jgi:hypothetical protein
VHKKKTNFNARGSICKQQHRKHTEIANPSWNLFVAICSCSAREKTNVRPHLLGGNRQEWQPKRTGAEIWSNPETKLPFCAKKINNEGIAIT